MEKGRFPPKRACVNAGPSVENEEEEQSAIDLRDPDFITLTEAETDILKATQNFATAGGALVHVLTKHLGPDRSQWYGRNRMVQNIKPALLQWYILNHWSAHLEAAAKTLGCEIASVRTEMTIAIRCPISESDSREVELLKKKTNNNFNYFVNKVIFKPARDLVQVELGLIFFFFAYSYESNINALI